MCGKRSTGVSLLSLFATLSEEQNVSPFFSTVCALFAQNCRGVPPLFLLRRLGANLELATVLYPERLPRGVPRAATHLLTSQQLPHSLRKRPGCTHIILYPGGFLRGAILELATSLPARLKSE